MAVGLEAVEGEDPLALRSEERPQPLVIGQAERDQFLIAVDEVSDGPFRYSYNNLHPKAGLITRLLQILKHPTPIIILVIIISILTL